MVSTKVPKRVKPTEMVPQQASMTVTSLAAISIEQVQAICQVFLGEFRESADEICLNAYTASLAKKESAERKLAIQRTELRRVEAELEALRQEESLMAQSTDRTISEFCTEAERSLAVLVQQAILTPEDAEQRVRSALVKLRAMLDEAGHELGVRMKALEEKAANQRCLVDNSEAMVTSLSIRLADLQSLPAVARHIASLEDERKREREQAKATIRFLRMASWGDLSRDRKVTPKLLQAATLGNQNVAVFDALVERLSIELDHLNSLPPAVAWSVIRVIEQLGLQDMFPDLAEKRSDLALLARAHKREKRARRTEELPAKVVSLASRWGARLAASR